MKLGAPFVLSFVRPNLVSSKMNTFVQQCKICGTGATRPSNTTVTQQHDRFAATSPGRAAPPGTERRPAPSTRPYNRPIPSTRPVQATGPVLAARPVTATRTTGPVVKRLAFGSEGRGEAHRRCLFFEHSDINQSTSPEKSQNSLPPQSVKFPLVLLLCI